jgi:transposase-like protein
MSDDYQRIELITGTARRRRWTTEQKLRIIEASCEPGESVSSVARRYGVAPNLLYRWRRLMAQGGAAAVGSDEPVVGNSEPAIRTCCGMAVATPWRTQATTPVPYRLAVRYTELAPDRFKNFWR